MRLFLLCVHYVLADLAVLESGGVSLERGVLSQSLSKGSLLEQESLGLLRSQDSLLFREAGVGPASKPVTIVATAEEEAPAGIRGITQEQEVVAGKSAATKALSEKAALKSSFITEQTLLERAQGIPPPPSTASRFMTYNVENLKNRQAVLDTIVKADPHTVTLQEVPGKEIASLTAEMEAKGYKSVATCTNFRIGNGVLGNVIFSKHPIKSTNSYNLYDPYGRRCLVEAVVATPLGDVVTYGTHLSNKGGWFRSWQMDKISALSRERTAQGLPHQIVMADMNAKSDEIAKSPIPPLFTDSFAVGGQEVPKATQWRGNRIDFVYLSPSLVETSGTRTQSTLVHSGASDHVPLISDVHFGQPAPVAQQAGTRVRAPVAGAQIVQPQVVALAVVPRSTVFDAMPSQATRDTFTTSAIVGG